MTNDRKLADEDLVISKWVETNDKTITLWLLNLVDVASTNKKELEQLKQQILQRYNDYPKLLKQYQHVKQEKELFHKMIKESNNKLEEMIKKA